MEILIPIIALIMIFGFIPATVLGRHYLRLLEKREERAALGGGQLAQVQGLLRALGDDPTQFRQLVTENEKLQKRVENLETIVCSVELDVNQRIERLFRETQNSLSRMAALEGVSLSRQMTGLVDPLPDLGSRYRLIEEIGRGGMGTVYRAQDQKLNETVALKVLSQHIAVDPQAVERFCHEASAARRITNPNVIRIHDLGEERSRVYISMEYFPSVSLKQLLRREGALSGERLHALGRQIIDGLVAAHLQGVVHRDLKPHNILVGKGDQVKIIDFGLAKSTLLHGLTATGTIMGTPEYMSPEQVRGQTVGESGDLYSLGVVLYEMITGDVPFHGENPIAIGYRHLQDEPTPLERRAGATVPPGLAAIVTRLLQKSPEDRFASAKDLQAAWAELGR